jgi:hypothetical protein
MGRYCKICRKVRSNESFSGGGHKNCICKNCQKLPKEELNFIRVKDELLGYWDQSNISKLNMKRLDQLKHFQSEDIRKLAHLTFEVASVKPHKRKRMSWLRKNRGDLFDCVKVYFGGDFNEGEDGEICQESTRDDEIFLMLEAENPCRTK